MLSQVVPYHNLGGVKIGTVIEFDKNVKVGFTDFDHFKSWLTKCGYEFETRSEFNGDLKVEITGEKEL